MDPSSESSRPSESFTSVNDGKHVSHTSAVVGDIERLVITRLTQELQHPLRRANYRSKEQIVSVLSDVRSKLEELKYVKVLELVETLIYSPESEYFETITLIQGILSKFCLLEVPEEVTLESVRGAAWVRTQLREFKNVVARRTPKTKADRLYPRSRTRVTVQGERTRARNAELSKKDQDEFDQYIARELQLVRDEARGDAVQSLLLRLGRVLEAFEADRYDKGVSPPQ